jgi:PIN domain nuclease of toxin-antitoxin system
LAISAITLFERAWQSNSGRVQVAGRIDDFVKECAAAFTVLAINAEVALQAVRLPNSYPNDPQDRLIGATALVEGAPLVTADDRLAAAV